MDAENAYGIGFFIAGRYHILCREGEEYRFHLVMPHQELTPEKLSYHEARKFIETHPVCANIATHEIRIMSYHEIMDIVRGKTPGSAVKSLAISSEEEEEKPLH